MRVCPKDFLPCCDDICHGAGCVRCGGEEMLDVCQHCHEPMIDGVCECSEDEYDDFHMCDEVDDVF